MLEPVFLWLDMQINLENELKNHYVWKTFCEFLKVIDFQFLQLLYVPDRGPRHITSGEIPTTFSQFECKYLHIKAESLHFELNN